MTQFNKFGGAYGGPFFKPFIRFYHNVKFPIQSEAGGPPDSTTGSGRAGTGSLYLDHLTGVWYVNQGTKLVPSWVPYSGGFTTGITAHAGGGQTLATQLNAGIDVVTVVATSGDSVKLPLAVAGMEVMVINLAAGVPSAPPYLSATLAAFAVLGNTAVTNTGSSVLTGDLGISPGSAITGFPPGTFSGTLHQTDTTAATGQTDLTTAVAALNALAVTEVLTGIELGTGGTRSTLNAGVYTFASSGHQTGALTFDAQGNPNAQFVIRTGTTYITASSASMILANGAKASNVFFVVGSSATLGTSTAFIGNILAAVSITVNTSASIVGRLLAQTGAVTLDTNIVAGTSAGVSNAMQVFGSGTDTINGVAFATGVSQAANTMALYVATSSAPGGNWEVSVLSIGTTVSGGSSSSAPFVPVALSGNTAIDPNSNASYVITKTSAAADTFAAPTNPGSKTIVITSDTAFAHTLTFTGGTLDSGSAFVTTATFNAFKGSSITLETYNGRFKVISANGVSFS